MIYFILLILCYLAFQVSKRNRKQQTLFAVFFLVSMMLLVGARDISIGVDSERYAEDIAYVKEITTITYEPLYQMCINFTNELGGSVLVFFMLLSILTYSLYSISVIKFSKNPILSVLIFMVSFAHFFPETMNNLRQSVAIMVLLLSYIMMSRNHFLGAALLFVLAIGFHMSSLIMLPFYFIAFQPNLYKYVGPVLLSTFILGLISMNLFSAHTMASYFSFTSEIMMTGIDKFSGYTGDAHTLTAFGMITSILPLNIQCFLLRPSLDDSKEYKRLFNFYFLGCVVGNLIAGSIPFVMRFMYMFLIVESLIITYKYPRSKSLKLYLIITMIFYCVYLLGFWLSGEKGMIIPYKLNPEIFS